MVRTIELSILLLGQPRHVGVAIDLRPGVARTTGERLTQSGRVDVAIERIPQGTEVGVTIEQRMAAGGFSGVDEFEIDTRPRPTTKRRATGSA